MSRAFILLKFFNVFLRIGGIGSKFIIFTLMSKYFDVDVFVRKTWNISAHQIVDV